MSRGAGPRGASPVRGGRSAEGADSTGLCVVPDDGAARLGRDRRTSAAGRGRVRGRGHVRQRGGPRVIPHDRPGHGVGTVRAGDNPQVAYLPDTGGYPDRRRPTAKRPPGPPSSGRPCSTISPTPTSNRKRPWLTPWPRWRWRTRSSGAGAAAEGGRARARARPRPAGGARDAAPPTRAIARRSPRAARRAVRSRATSPAFPEIIRRGRADRSLLRPVSPARRPVPRDAVEYPQVVSGQGYARYATPVGPAPGAGPGYHATTTSTPAAPPAVDCDSGAGAAVTSGLLGLLLGWAIPGGDSDSQEGPTAPAAASDSHAAAGTAAADAGCAPAPGSALHRASCGRSAPTPGAPTRAGPRRRPANPGTEPPPRRPDRSRSRDRRHPPGAATIEAPITGHITRIHAKKGATVPLGRAPVHGARRQAPRRRARRHRACRRPARAPRRAGQRCAPRAAARSAGRSRRLAGCHPRPASRRRPRLVLEGRGPERSDRGDLHG